MKIALRSLLLVILTGVAFWPIFECEFLVYDDPLYVTDIVFVPRGLSWDNIRWAFTTFEAANWHPLMWLSLMLDADLYGLNPVGFHATNLLMHVTNTLLLFWLLNRVSVSSNWVGFVVALLFAIHPLHVESVAWVAERKDVLFTAFGLLALHSYVSYARGSRPAYWWTVVFLMLSLMSKSMLVTFPFLLLVLDYWPLCRVASRVSRRDVPTSNAHSVDAAAETTDAAASAVPTTQQPDLNVLQKRTWLQLVLEKWLLFLVVVSVTAVAWLAQAKGGTIASVQTMSLPIRLANAVLGYGLYLRDAVWPAELSVIYLHPQGNISFGQAGVVLVALLAVSGLLFRFRERVPAAWVGWCWYIGTLVPVIGLIQVGLQQRADRYTYFPLIGIFWGVVWCVSERLPKSGAWRLAAVGTTTLIVGAFVVATHAQVGHWKTSQSLFEHALEVDPKNAVAHHNLGFAAEKSGDFETALVHYRQATSLDPTLLGAQLSLAHALLETASGPNKAAQQQEAVRLIKSILSVNPKHPHASNNRGNLLRDVGRREEALKCFETALEGLPYNVAIRSNLAVTLFELERRDEARKQFDEAKRLDPNNPTLLLNLGVVEFQSGNIRKAVEFFERAEQVAPERQQAKRFHASARLTLGAHYMQQGKFSEALREFQRSEERESRVWQLQVNFGEVYLQLNRPKLAEKRFLAALELQPSSAEAHFGLGRVYSDLQQRKPAIEHLTAALKLRPDFQPAQELLDLLKNDAP